MRVGDIVLVTTDNCRIPRDTRCVIEAYTSTMDQYYIRNIESQYCCWVRKEDLEKEVVR